MKQEKIARIAYVGGKQDFYEIQIWDSENSGWGLATAFPFTASVEYPDAGKDFLHFEIVKKILHLIDLGYYVQPEVVTVNK